MTAEPKSCPLSWLMPYLAFIASLPDMIEPLVCVCSLCTASGATGQRRNWPGHSRTFKVRDGWVCQDVKGRADSVVLVDPLESLSDGI